jgi:hypothetical protein
MDHSIKLRQSVPRKCAESCEIVADWPACNPGCDYETPMGWHQDGRDRFCCCDAAKASIARQRAAVDQEGGA